MNITINPKPLTGRVAVVSSKSLSHRYLIASGLAEGTSTIKNVLNSDDIDATREALEAFGVKFDGKKVVGHPRILNRNVIDCKESGSTLRFMIPIFLLQKESVTFNGSGRLPERSLDVYFDIFKKKNIHFEKPEHQNLPLTIKGPLTPGLYQMRGDVSSQFLSGLLFALPLLKKDSVIEITTELESQGYVNLTLNVLRLFNIHILQVDQYFYIKGGQKYQSQTATVEGDYSQAAFWMVAGLIGKSIELRHLNPISLQGDYKVVDIIKSMVGKIEYQNLKRVYKVKPSETFGMTIDLSQIPDLGPILMVLAALSTNETTFTNASRLRIKESDRLEAMYQTLLRFGVEVSMDQDTMKIKGTKTLKGNQAFDSYGDHRIAMAIAIAAIRADGPVTILNAEVVSKSYPKFFEVYQSLGGDIHES
jgi:3-phosphoshikimate 1-carboxyvinyltransferase